VVGIIGSLIMLYVYYASVWPIQPMPGPLWPIIFVSWMIIDSPVLHRQVAVSPRDGANRASMRPMRSWWELVLGCIRQQARGALPVASLS